MQYRTRLKLFAVLALIMLAGSGPSYGQWIPLNGVNYYDPNSEKLHLPSVYVLPDTSQVGTPQLIYSPVFQNRGGSNFELISTQELQPEQVCTRAEVLNAIPQMRLELSIDELNAMIGCTAIIRRGQADLETGLSVTASWTGRDGVPHITTGVSAGGFLNVTGSNSASGPGATPAWWPQVFNPFRPVNFLSFSGNPSFILPSDNFGFVGNSGFGTPFITLQLRENVAEAYSYSTAGQTSGMPQRACQNLQVGFDLLSIGDTLEELTSKLACDGGLNLVTVTAADERRDYRWQQAATGFFNPLASQQLSRPFETVSAILINNTAQSFNLRSSETFASVQECTVEAIVAAAQQIQVGDVVDDLSTLLDCGTRSESVVNDGSSIRATTQWQTQIASGSQFTSENRTLFVSVEDNRVTAVIVQRY